jgi:choline monooxygenase
VSRTDLAAALAEIARFDPELPLERASTPPGSWYTDPAILALERERLFFRSWHAAARLDQLAAPGAFVADALLGEPYLVVRAGDELRALANVCVHHAARIASGAGRCEELVCPYHGWTYDLQGRLIRAPRAGGMDHLPHAQRALRSFAVRAWGDLALLCLEQPAPDWAQWVAPLPAELWRGELSPLRFVARRSYTLRCNWKVFVDNYLDGGYHVAAVHPELAAGLDLDGYRTQVFERSVLQSAGRAAGSRDERLGQRALYVWIHPALALNRYGPVLDVNRVVPLAAERTRVIFDFYFEEHAARDAGFVERSIAESDGIQRQDARICEAVQAGLRSRSFERGRYAPRFEAGMHRFHCLLAADLTRRAPEDQPNLRRA